MLPTSLCKGLQTLPMYFEITPPIPARLSPESTDRHKLSRLYYERLSIVIRVTTCVWLWVSYYLLLFISFNQTQGVWIDSSSQKLQKSLTCSLFFLTSSNPSWCTTKGQFHKPTNVEEIRTNNNKQSLASTVH